MNSLKSTKESVIDLKSINYPPPLNSKSIFIYLSRLSLFSYRFLLLFLIVAGYSRNMNAQNYSLQFDGQDDFFEIPAYPGFSLGTSDFTMEAWVNGSTNSGNYLTIFTNRVDTMSGFLLGVNNLGILFMRFDSVTYESQKIGNLLNGVCHHITVTRKQDTLCFYMDGILKDIFITANIHSVTSGQSIMVGYDPADAVGSFFNGTMEDIRIWETTRSSTEILNNYQVCLIGNETGLLANWRFDQQPSLSVVDFSINRHHGIIHEYVAGPIVKPLWVTNACQGNTTGCWIFPVSHLDPACVPIIASPCSFEMVCNGGFEQGIPIAASMNLHTFGSFEMCNLNGSSQDVVNWCDFTGTCDYFIRALTPFGWNDIPNNYFTVSNTFGAVQTWDWPVNAGNNRYAGFAVSHTGVPGVISTEGMMTDLLIPASMGNEYRLTMQAYITRHPGTPGTLNINDQGNIRIFLQESSNGGATFLIGIAPITYNGTWQPVAINFNFNHPVNMNNLVIVGDDNIPIGFSAYFFVDDVSLRMLDVFPPFVATGIGSQRPENMVIDASGNVFITGYIHDDANFAGTWIPGTPPVSPAIPNQGMYVAGFDPCGFFLWVHFEPFWWGKGVAVNNTGTLYVTGKDNLGQAFVRSYNPVSGVPITTVIHSAFIEGKSVIVDNAGNAIVLFQESATDYRVARINNTTLLVVAFTISQSGLANDIVQNPVNNQYYVCGSNGFDAFITAFDPVTLWSSGISTTVTSISGHVRANSIAVNNTGDVFITGFLGVSATFGSVVASVIPHPWGNTGDMFVASFDVNLTNSQWVNVAGDYWDDEGIAICTDVHGDVYVTGFFHYGIAFLNNALSDPARGVFIVKFDQNTGADFWATPITTLAGIGGTGTAIAWHNLPGYPSYVVSLSYFMDRVNAGLWNLNATGCDNTLLVKVQDHGGSAIIQRQGVQGYVIPDKKQGVNLRVFPNPTTGHFEINMLKGSPENTTLSLFDFTGRMIWEKDGNRATIQTDMLRLDKGIYLVKARSGNEVSTQKLVIH
jgi:hypothetical protein